MQGRYDGADEHLTVHLQPSVSVVYRLVLGLKVDFEVADQQDLFVRIVLMSPQGLWRHELVSEPLGCTFQTLNLPVCDMAVCADLVKDILADGPYGGVFVAGAS